MFERGSGPDGLNGSATVGESAVTLCSNALQKNSHVKKVLKGFNCILPCVGTNHSSFKARHAIPQMAVFIRAECNRSQKFVKEDNFVSKQSQT